MYGCFLAEEVLDAFMQLAPKTMKLFQEHAPTLAREVMQKIDGVLSGERILNTATAVCLNFLASEMTPTEELDALYEFFLMECEDEEEAVYALGGSFALYLLSMPCMEDVRPLMEQYLLNEEDMIIS